MNFSNELDKLGPQKGATAALRYLMETEAVIPVYDSNAMGNEFSPRRQKKVPVYLYFWV